MSHATPADSAVVVQAAAAAHSDLLDAAGDLLHLCAAVLPARTSPAALRTALEEHPDVAGVTGRLDQSPQERTFTLRWTVQGVDGSTAQLQLGDGTTRPTVAPAGADSSAGSAARQILRDHPGLAADAQLAASALAAQQRAVWAQADLDASRRNLLDLIALHGDRLAVPTEVRELACTWEGTARDLTTAAGLTS